MGTTKVEVCNQALLNIGQRSIQSLEELSREANLCKMVYDRARKELLRTYPWRFAVATKLLALKDATSQEYAFVYAAPDDCLRELYILPAEPPIEYERQGDNILTDTEAAELKYIRNVIDPAEFDESFVECLGYLMATKMAMPLTGKSELQGNNLKLYLNALPMAQSASASEARKTTPGSSKGTIAGSRS